MKTFLLALSLTLLSGHITAQQSAKPLSVGIFVYPGVEILDFSGPAEVFAATDGYEAFIVSYDKEPIISQGFIKVTPEYSIADCPPTDILVFPGGGTRAMLEKPDLIAWIKERSKSTQIMLSVCTGAALLSEAGLLDGKEATTWYGFIPELQKMTPDAKILENTRFVDNGHVVTTAGISAGIDGALHVVSRMKGEDVAKATARYMEYDKWVPQAGKVHPTPFLFTVRDKGIQAALKKYPQNKNSVQPLYYPGELINLATELSATQPEESEAIYKWLIKSGDATIAVYDKLGALWTTMRKAAPMDSKTFMDKVRAGEVSMAKQKYQEINENHPGWLLFTEEQLNGAAYHLMQSGKQNEALAAFDWATQLYPSSANAWDSYAEALENAGNFPASIKATEKSLMYVNDVHDRGMAELLKRSGEERLQRLKAKN